jgi:hypothetical protein
MKTMIRICLAVAVVGMTAGSVRAQDERLTPGGVEVSALSDGSPAVGVDLLRVKAAPGDKRSFPRRAYQATTNNVISHPALYTAGAVVAALAASGELQEFIGIGGDDKGGKNAPKVPAAESKPKPGLVVGGTGNSFTAPATVISGPAYVGGVGNTVNIYEPAPATTTP